MLQHLFIRVLNMSLTGSLMILAVLIVRLFLKRAPKIFSYALWLVVLFRLLCPVSFESGFSLLGILGVDAEEQGTVEYISDSFVPGTQTGQTIAVPVNTTAEEGKQELRQADTAQEGMLIWNTDVFQTSLRVGSVVWIIGAAGLLIYGGGTYMRLKRKMCMTDKTYERIYRTDAVSTAFVLGVFRPMIYLPNNLEEKEERYILLHEQIHIRRRDSLYRAAGYLALCMHWMNPLVWLAFYVSGIDMEMSCDEAVIRKIGSGVKKEYSRSLLALATGTSKIRGVPLAFGEGDTGGRIKNVLRYKKPAVILVAAAIVLCLSVAVFLLGNPKGKSTDTVYYGIIKASNGEDTAENVVFVPGLGEMEIPEAETVDTHIEIDFFGLEPGQLVRMTFPGDVKVNLSSDMPGSFSEAAESIYVKGIGFDIRPAGEDRYLFTVPIGMANEAVAGDTLEIYHHMVPEGDIRELYHLYLLDAPDEMETELIASAKVEEVVPDNYDIWVTLSTEEVQTFLSEFGFGVYCEIVENDASDVEVRAEELSTITYELLGSYNGSLPDDTYRVQVRSIARSARGIDRYRIYGEAADSRWDDDNELPFLVFDDDCNYWVNRELDTVRYEEVDYEEFVEIVADVLEYREPALDVVLSDGKIEEAYIQSAYLGYGFTAAPLSGMSTESSAAGIDTWYTDVQDYTGLSAEEVLEEYYELVRTEKADVSDLAGEETIEIYIGNIGDGDSGIVMIRDNNGNLLCTLSAHISRAGWMNIYLGEMEGTSYLLEVHIEDRDNYGGYDYRVFRPGENGERRYIADSSFEFGSYYGYDDDLFHIWADKLEYYLENSHLLLSTQEGEVRTEAISEADKYNYETLRR